MPPVQLGLSFPGIGTLPRLKLRPTIARKMLLEAHRWTATEALGDEIVDQIGKPDEILNFALEIAGKWASMGKAGVYGILREELYGEASRALKQLSYMHSRDVSISKAKI